MSRVSISVTLWLYIRKSPFVLHVTTCIKNNLKKFKLPNNKSSTYKHTEITKELA